jgi:hypothetical protein
MEDHIRHTRQTGRRPKRPPVAGECAPRPRGLRVDDRLVLSNLPQHLPTVPEEADLLRIYFADLIADMLKASS